MPHPLERPTAAVPIADLPIPDLVMRAQIPPPHQTSLPTVSAWRQAPREEPAEEGEGGLHQSDLPPDLQFTPVKRRALRTNGLTPDRQRRFIAALARGGSVRLACKVIGCSTFAIYHLRNSAGSESFSSAWDNAVRRGARRVLDVMVDNAVNGTPEYLYQNGQLVAERRRFNTRGQMWLVAHYMPDQFAVEGGLMHHPGSAARMKWQKEQWRKEWHREQMSKSRSLEDMTESILTKLAAIDRPRMVAFAKDPEKRAAYELINGRVDWGEFE